MKINIIKTITALAIVLILAIPTLTSAESTLSTAGGNTGGADTNANKTSGSFIPSTGGGNTGGADTAPAVTPAPAPTPTSGGSSGGSMISSGGGFVVLTQSPSLTKISECSPYLNDYLKLGNDNNKTEITKLQTFLKNTEKLDVDINGIFDTKTFEAVKVFQKKYLNDVMTPWGSNNPTGQVYFTTKKKVNEIYCKSVFALTAEQLAQIEIYKKSLQNNATDLGVNNTNITSTGTIPLLPEVGANGIDTQTAAVADTSILGKIWNFIKWLFGY